MCTVCIAYDKKKLLYYTKKVIHCHLLCSCLVCKCCVKQDNKKCKIKRKKLSIKLVLNIQTGLPFSSNWVAPMFLTTLRNIKLFKQCSRAKILLHVKAINFLGIVKFAQ